MADSEVTTAQIAEILTTHKVGKSDMDCDEGCCWQHYCNCGALIYPTLEDHIAGVLLASFDLVPKGQLHQETVDCLTEKHRDTEWKDREGWLWEWDSGDEDGYPMWHTTAPPGDDEGDDWIPEDDPIIATFAPFTPAVGPWRPTDSKEGR